MTPPLKIIALLGREPGLQVLEHALLNNPGVELVGVMTHGRLPRAEGGTERPELARFQSLCQRANVPLHAVEFPQARHPEVLFPPEPFDLLISLSWRAILCQQCLDIPRLGGINLHRGALPQYPGAEPVRRAIEAGDRRVAITAHRMVAEVDAGDELARVWLDIPAPQAGQSAADLAETVKTRLYALYAPLARLAIASARHAMDAS